MIVLHLFKRVGVHSMGICRGRYLHLKQEVTLLP